MRFSVRKKIHAALTGLLLWIIAIVVLIPFFLIVWNSFKNKAESNLMTFAWPSEFHPENYPYVWTKSEMLRSFFNSMLIASGSVLLSTVLSALTAFVLSRNRSRMNRLYYWLILVGLVLPTNMLPTIRVMKMLGIMGAYIGIILLYAALLIPLAVFLYYSFISKIPRSLDEAALLDGAGGAQLFFRVILPSLKPVTITVVVINFMYAWNDFQIPLYVLNDSNKWGMVQAVYSYYGFYQTNWNYICTVIVLTLIPVIAVYIVGQKYIINGMVAGAVKG